MHDQLYFKLRLRHAVVIQLEPAEGIRITIRWAKSLFILFRFHKDLEWGSLSYILIILYVPGYANHIDSRQCRMIPGRLQFPFLEQTPIPQPKFAVLSAQNQLGVQDNVKREEKCTERSVHDIPELTLLHLSLWTVPVPWEPPTPICTYLR